MKIVLASILCITLIFLYSCTAARRPEGDVTFFSFSHSGSSTGSIYTYRAEQTDDGWRADLSLQCGAHEHAFSMTDKEAEQLCTLIDSCQLWKWHGFDKTDSRTLDGSSFRLMLRYSDESERTARGSNAFPDGYNTALSEINAFFHELMEAHEINHNGI